LSRAARSTQVAAASTSVDRTATYGVNLGKTMPINQLPDTPYTSRLDFAAGQFGPVDTVVEEQTNAVASSGWRTLRSTLLVSSAFKEGLSRAIRLEPSARSAVVVIKYHCEAPFFGSPPAAYVARRRRL
jgi:hypothetical protein